MISGPLVADDGETMIGSCFLVEAGTKDEVLAFHNADPFKAAGVWEHVHINPFLKRDGQPLRARKSAVDRRDASPVTASNAGCLSPSVGGTFGSSARIATGVSIGMFEMNISSMFHALPHA